MTKWVFDHRTGQMVPEKKTGLSIDFLVGGVRVIDNDQPGVEFMITRDDKVITRNPRGCKVLDYRKANELAMRIKRAYPRSKYGNFKEFLRESVDMKVSAEDKAMLRCLLEEVNPADVDTYVESLNEDYWFGVLNPTSSAGKTPGTTQHGLHGAINALPSAILSFLVCPPAAILQYIGAVRARSEKRWLKTRINPERWLDFIATPNERKKEIKDKIKEEMAKNVEYYIATLANGEIIRVVGSSTLEAREMVEVLEQEIYFKRGESMVEEIKQNSGSENFKTWRVIFDDGEVTYVTGDTDKRLDIMKLAQQSKDDIVESYKDIYKEITGKRMKGMGKETEEIRYPIKSPKADDVIELETAYMPINEKNYKNYEIIKADHAGQWKQSYNTYVVNIGKSNDEPIFTFNIPATTELELNKIMTNFIKNANVITALDECDRLVNTANGNVDYSLFKVQMTNKDVLILPGPAITDEEKNQTTYIGGVKQDTIAGKQRLQILRELAEKLEEYLYEAVFNDDEISKETKAYYRKYSGNKGGAAKYYRYGIAFDEDYAIDFKYADIINELTGTEIDTRTGEENEVELRLAV